MNKKSITQLLVRSVICLALIHTIDMHTSCSLIQAPGSPYTLGPNPSPVNSIAYSPDGQYFTALVASRFVAPLEIFSVNSATGELVLSSTAPVPGGGEEVVVYSPNGQFGVVTTGGDHIQTYTINSVTGVWTPGAVTTTIGGGDSIGAAYSPDGRFIAIATNFSNARVGMYSVDQTTGALTGIAEYPTTSEPNSVAYSPNGAFVAVQGGESVNIFNVNSSTGLLTEVSGSPLEITGVEFSAVTYSPDSRFVAVGGTNSTEGVVYVFAVSDTGAFLDTVPGVPYITERGVITVAYSIDGSYAVVSDVSAGLYIYSVNKATGVWTQLPASPFPIVGEFPAYQIAFAPNSIFFATNDYGTVGVQAFPLGVALSAAAIDAFGRVTAMGYGALPGATITLFANCTTVIGTGTADSLGNFTIVASTLLPTNLYEITATQTVDDCTSVFSNQILVGATMISAFIQRVIDKYNSGC